MIDEIVTEPPDGWVWATDPAPCPHCGTGLRVQHRAFPIAKGEGYTTMRWAVRVDPFP